MKKEQLAIDIVGLAGACSYALDCIEAELVNIKNKHGKRVAYISVRMAEYWAIQSDALQDLAICALLHDNALTQYISEELKNNSDIDLAVFENVNREDEYKIRNEIDELDIIYKIDLVFINNNTKMELLKSIEMEGVDF